MQGIISVILALVGLVAWGVVDEFRPKPAPPPVQPRSRKRASDTPAGRASEFEKAYYAQFMADNGGEEAVKEAYRDRAQRYRRERDRKIDPAEYDEEPF